MNLIAAWAVTLTLDAGRFFNYPAGAWTLATCPGVEVSRGPLTINASVSYDRQGYFARDVAVSLEKSTEHLTLALGVARYDYPGYAPDVTASVSLRWRIK